MIRMTLERVNGIKTGYWSPNKKEELVQRLAAYENTGLEPGEVRKLLGSRKWIPVEERLPEDVYTSSELHEKWFLITNPCSEEKLVQRMRCVPSGYVWHDGYDTHRAVAWRYIEPYKPERRAGE